MHCRKCKRNGKDIEMLKSQQLEFTREIRRKDGTLAIDTIQVGGNRLKCPECGWSVSV